MKEVWKDGEISYEDGSDATAGTFSPNFRDWPREFPFRVFNDGKVWSIHDGFRFALWPEGLAAWSDGHRHVKTVLP